MNSKTIKAYVSQHHIDNGMQGVPNGCPLALSLEDATGLKWRVGPYRISSYDLERPFDASLHCPTPKAVEVWIRAFDRGEEVKPFQFEIEPLP
jgi:hypothetical protein